MIQQVDALILAGTKNYPKMKYLGGEECKPFIPILGKTLVEYVIDAALDSERIRRVYVVTDADRLEGILQCR
jgi:GTP:adenosylcobinamide-phosphate guanylyltransferase